jgi:hypothetical protein
MTHRPRPAQRPTPPSTSPRQLSMALDSVKLRGMNPDERALVVARLTNLLMEAAGIVAGDCGDDGR